MAQTLTEVEEYCINEDWVKVAAGKARDRKGKPLMITLTDKVEAFTNDFPGRQLLSPVTLRAIL